MPRRTSAGVSDTLAFHALSSSGVLPGGLINTSPVPTMTLRTIAFLTNSGNVAQSTLPTTIRS